MTTPSQEELIELAYQRTQERLQVQASIASAADQRALVFATIAVAVATLVFSSLSKEAPLFSDIATSLFCISAALSGLSAMPSKIYTSGSASSELRDHIDKGTDFHLVMLGLCKNNDAYIEANGRTASARAHIFKLAVYAFMVGALISMRGFWVSP